MTHPAVSVVMPVYNVERFVGAAIQSVLDQSMADFELLIVDDGGNDRSMDICGSFKDPRIRIIRQANRGLAGARNTGIRNARAPLLAFLDSDDLWAPEKLERHSAHLQDRPDIGVSFAPSRLIAEDGTWLGLVQTPKLTNITPFDVFTRNPVGNGSAPVIRRATLDAIGFPGENGETWWFDETFRQSEDVECWMRIALTTPFVFEGLPQPLTDYRIAASGLSANVLKQRETWERMVAKMRIYAPAFTAANERAARAYQVRYLARRAISMNDGPLALRLTWQGIRSYPRMIIAEPARTLTTLGAALAQRLLPLHLYKTMERFGLACAGMARRVRHG